jgi:cytoskeleton protein RodZ
LKIDPDPILERLPPTTATPLKTDESGINVPFRASRDGSGVSFWDQLSKPFVMAVLALLVGVLVLVLFPFTQRTEVASAPKSETAALISPRPTPMATDSPASTEPAAPGQPSSLTTSSLDMSLATNPQSVAPAASLPGSAAIALPVIVPGSGATSGMVVFKARGVSWVEVVDASGVVQLRKTMADGDVVGASGAMPLSVVVGRADTTEVQVRGKPFDVTRVAKDNVARFEVK